MSEFVTYNVCDDVAVIAVANPSVNARASDIDVVYLNGYGFPSWRPGPMICAGLAGLGDVVDRIRQFERDHGPHWTPAPLRARLAGEGRTFRYYDKEAQ